MHSTPHSGAKFGVALHSALHQNFRSATPAPLRQIGVLLRSALQHSSLQLNLCFKNLKSFEIWPKPDIDKQKFHRLCQRLPDFQKQHTNSAFFFLNLMQKIPSLECSLEWITPAVTPAKFGVALHSSLQ